MSIMEHLEMPVRLGAEIPDQAALIHQERA